MVCFNSSANVIVYYLNGKKLRDAWIETYGNCCCCCGPAGANRGKKTGQVRGLRTGKRGIVPWNLPNRVKNYVKYTTV